MALAGRLAAIVAASALVVLPLARAESAPGRVQAPRAGMYLVGDAQRAGDTLAFIHYTTNLELWIRRVGEKPVPLTHIRDFPRQTWTASMSLSPDGTRLVFCRDGAGSPSVYVINTDGSGLQRLADGCYPVWSPDGRRIAFANGGTDSYSTPIWVINADGNHLQRATLPGAQGVFTHLPERTPLTWAPGRQIVFDGTRIFKLNPDTHRETALTPPHIGYWPAWSPDGRRVAYVRNGHGRGVRELHVITAAGHDRTLTGGHDDALPIWTDATHLLFDRARHHISRIWAPPTELYVISTANASRPHRLTEAEHQRWFP
jgi:dipeptidyl aminopeptidase/acylaminoacyl peptidase